MNTPRLAIGLSVLLMAACAPPSADEHGHGPDPIVYTLYTDQTELFVEFKPLVLGSRSSFAAHFTRLGERFLPMTEGKVTVSLIVGTTGIRNSADAPSSPGIFRLALRPTVAGQGRLVFDIESPDGAERIVIEPVTVYPDEASAAAALPVMEPEPGDITYLKEQAWKVDFATVPVRREPFRDVIKAAGRLVSAPNDERVVVAGASGTVRFPGSGPVLGSAVGEGADLFVISGGGMASGNPEAAYLEAKAAFEKAEADYRRLSVLAEDNSVSQRELIEAKAAFDIAKARFDPLASRQTADGQRVTSPIRGFVSDIRVRDGQYVEVGAPLAVITANRTLRLEVNLPLRHSQKAASITSATFRIPGSPKIHTLEAFNGTKLSSGNIPGAGFPFIPVSFQLTNNGELMAGSMADVRLKTAPIPEALLIPVSALMEEQGTLYVYVQISGERFVRREVTLGANDGLQAQVLSGVSEGERVVSLGAYRIRLSSVSGELPAHGHEH